MPLLAILFRCRLRLYAIAAAIDVIFDDRLFYTRYALDAVTRYSAGYARLMPCSMPLTPLTMPISLAALPLRLFSPLFR